jgi:hypothetical protein
MKKEVTVTTRLNDDDLATLDEFINHPAHIIKPSRASAIRYLVLKGIHEFNEGTD